MGKKIRLYKFTGENITIVVDAFFDDYGNLLVEGYDIGKDVIRWWGDSDYEYSITVPKKSLDSLRNALELQNSDDDEILKKIEKNFSGNSGFSAFGNFLTNHGIAHDSFSWI